MRASIAILCLIIASASIGHANLLDNAGFETAGTTAQHAENWEWGNPDNHGSIWGTASRESWRSHSGTWEAAIRGTWAGDTGGGWWQETEATAGATYVASAWFWADTTWTNQQDQAIKLEFYSGDTRGTNFLSSVTNAFSGITTNWVQKSIQGVAPEGCTWVRVVFYVNNAGSQGALQVDDVLLEAKPGSVIILSQMPVLALVLLLSVMGARCVRRKHTSAA